MNQTDMYLEFKEIDVKSVIEFMYSLSLCEHTGDVWENILIFGDEYGIFSRDEFDDCSDLSEVATILEELYPFLKTKYE